MSNTITVKRGEELFEYNDTLGHQVNSNVVQILFRNGNSEIIANYDYISIEHDEEYKAKFMKDIELAEAQAAMDAAEAEAKGEQNVTAAIVS